MSIENYLNKMKTIQNYINKFIENDNIEEHYQNLIQIFNDQRIHDNCHEVKSILYLLVKLSNNHYRTPNFFSKIERILKLFLKDMQHYYSNYEIFNIFKSNKRLLLFLIEEKIITLEKSIVYLIINEKYKEANYPQYFFKEIKEKTSESIVKEIKNEIPENYEELRRIGENENKVCQLIRNDSIDDFKNFVNNSNLSLSDFIEPSIFETNPFLIKNETTMIEYAAFYGSFKIFKYLFQNEVKLTPMLWIYAVHGKNFEIIHLLEENKIEPKDDCEDCLIEGIRCHHNDIVNHIINNFFTKRDDNDYNVFSSALKYFNFAFIQKEFINESSFYDLCQYDYYSLVDVLLKISDIDINSKIIFNFVI